jgi:GTPase SAR1 family protein
MISIDRIPIKLQIWDTVTGSFYCTFFICLFVCLFHRLVKSHLDLSPDLITEVLPVRFWCMTLVGERTHGSYDVVYCLLISLRRDSFTHVSAWLEDARLHASDDITILLIGNKSDLEDQREVSMAEGEQFAQQNGLLFMETSVLKASHVDEVSIEVSYVSFP